MLDERGDEALGGGALDVDALDGDAQLAGVGEAGVYRGLGGAVEIGVGGKNAMIVAACCANRVPVALSAESGVRRSGLSTTALPATIAGIASETASASG